MNSNPHRTPLAHKILAVVAVLLVVSLVAFIYHAKNEASATLDRAAQASQSIPARKTLKATTTTTGAWTTYSSAAGQFSVRYPSTWVQPSHPEACGPFLNTDLEIGPDAQSVIKCASDGTVSQISITFTNGDHRTSTENTLQSKDYIANTHSAIQADGETGIEYTAKAMNQPVGLGSLPDGTIVIKDVFFVHNKTYVATYTQLPKTEKEGPTQNQQRVFKVLVTQGLQIK